VRLVPPCDGGAAVLVWRMLHVCEKDHAFAVRLLPVVRVRTTEQRVRSIGVCSEVEDVVVHIRGHQPRARRGIRLGV